MHGGIELEAKQLPTAVIAKTEIQHEAEVRRAALGMDGPVWRLREPKTTHAGGPTGLRIIAGAQ